MTSALAVSVSDAATRQVLVPPALRETDTERRAGSLGASESGSVWLAMRPATCWSVSAKLALQIEATTAFEPSCPMSCA